MADFTLQQFEQSISFDVRDYEIKDFWLINKKIDHKSITRKEKLSDKLFQSGPKTEFKKIFLDIIRSARNEIYLCSFIISDKEIIQELIRQSSNKTVIILTASEIRLLDDPDDSDEFQKRVKKEHLEFLDESYRKILIRSSANFHAKFILTDPKSKDSRGILFTGNFTTEAFERNFEIGVILNQTEIKDLFLQFMKGFYEVAERENLSEKKFSAIGRNFVRNIRNPQNTYYTIGNQCQLRDKIILMLKNSTGDIFISVYKLILESVIVKELIEQIKSKHRKLTLFTRQRDINTPAIKILADLNADVIAEDFLHAKFIFLPKEKEFLIFTANFSTEGIESGFETGIHYSNVKTGDIENLIKEWIKIFPHSFHKSMMIKDLPDKPYEKILSFKNNKLEKINLKEIDKRKLPDFTINTIKDQIPTIVIQKPKQEGNILYESIMYYRMINPPKLPNSAKQVNDKEILKDCNGFPLYQDKDQYFLVLNEEKKLKDIQKVAERFNATIIPRI